MTRGKNVVLCSGSNDHTTTTQEKWKKYHKSSIRARNCFQAVLIIFLSFLSSIFLDSTFKILLRLHHLAWIPVVFSLSSTLLFRSCLPKGKQSFRVVSLTLLPLYAIYLLWGSSRKQTLKNQGLFACPMAQQNFVGRFHQFLRQKIRNFFLSCGGAIMTVPALTLSSLVCSPIALWWPDEVHSS